MQEALLDHVSQLLRRGRVAVFCGAGISLNSGLPTANELTEAVISRLQAAPEVQARLMVSGLPFEAFMDVIKNMVGIEDLLAIFRLGQPNRTHRCIAELVRRRSVTTVCTTNFDTLVEAALAAAGLREGGDYVVLRTSSDFAEFNWDDERPKLLKLHGSIDFPSTIAILLRDVASRVLSPGRRSAIEHTFHSNAHNSVIVLGYSCSDIFDISPAIESLPSCDIEIIFIEHAQHTKPLYEHEDIRAATVRNPFRSFTAGHRYFANTDSVINNLCNKLEISPTDPASQSSRDRSAWRGIVEAWSQSLVSCYSQAALDITLGCLLHSVGELVAAREHFERGLVRSRELRDLRSEIMCLVNLSGTLSALDDWEEARAHLELASSKAHGQQDARLQFSISLGLARMCMNLNDVQEGLRLLPSLVSRAKELGDRNSEAALLGDIGTAHLHLGEPDRAQPYFCEALALAREIGDKHREGLCLGHLGQVHSQEGQVFDAVSCFQQARQIADEICDLQASGIHSYNLGTCYLALGLPPQAIEEFRRAVGAFRRVYGSSHRAVRQASQMVETLERGL